MSADDWRTRPHRRLNALTGEWVLVSPQRTERPWQGEATAAVAETTVPYDRTCYLCPGNARAGGAQNPAYEGTFAFDNDYAALLPDAPAGGIDDSDLIVARAERGRCRVLCFTPRHDLSIARMTVPAIRAVVDAWAQETARLGSEPQIASVVVFENYGAAMGASSPHPHAQIWATETIPNELAKELARITAYRANHDGACVLCDYVARELERAERIVYANDDVVVLVPFWAVWPFEAMLVPRRHVGSLDELTAQERDALADAMRVLTRAYDRIFESTFPYSMGFHQRPTSGAAAEDLHLHAHYLPPLLRSATVRKYMVGFELLAMPQRDITPESAAARLRELVDPPPS